MANCNFNGKNTGPYYPPLISTCSCGNSCSSTGGVVNPQIASNWFSAVLVDATNVDSSGVIPLTAQNINGKAVSLKSAGEFFLTAGSYLIIYNVNVVTSTSGEGVQVALFKGDDEIEASQGYATGSTDIARTISKQVLLNVEENIVLSLKNLSQSAVTFSNCNLIINKLQRNLTN